MLLVTNHFTKWVEIFPVPDQMATTCAEVILNEVIARYGSPLSIHSDQGKNYESKAFVHLCHLLEICKTRMSPRNSKCNGQAEWFDQTLLKMIKVYLKGKQRNQDKHLGCLAGAYQATIHKSTGLTPNVMRLGRENHIPAEVVFGQHTHKANATYGDFMWKLKEQMQDAHDVAQKNMNNAAKRQKELYDARIHANQYEIRDLVWLETDISQLDIALKL